MIIVGITGNIGSGKSSLRKYFHSLGYPCIDADDLVRSLYEPHSRIFHDLEKIKQKYNVIDREDFKQRVFIDKKLRSELEALLHPEVRILSQECFKKWKSQGHVLGFYEATLILETQREKDFHELIVVHSPYEQLIERIEKRNLWPRSHIEAIYKTQMPQQEKLARANYSLENAGDLHELQKEGQKILEALIEKYHLSKP